MDYKEKCELAKAFLKKNYGNLEMSSLEAIYSMSNLEDVHKYDIFRYGRLEETKFSKLEDSELFNKFSSEQFNNLSYGNVEKLFQEVYNRVAKSADCTPKHYVELTSKDNSLVLNPKCMGYLSVVSNKLVINEKVIRQALSNKNCEFNYFNKKTCGNMILGIVSHETEHSIQNEKSLDFVIGNKLDEEETFLAAINFVTLFLMNYKDSVRNSDCSVAVFLKNSYFHDYTEHDANMKALKVLTEVKKISNNDSIDESLANFSKYTMNIRPNEQYNEENNRKYTVDRIDKMRAVALTMLKYYKKIAINSELKDRVCKVMEDYLKFDENNNCKFADKLIKDFAMCNEYILANNAKNESVNEK